MIGVKMRQHDRANLLWLDTDLPQLGADLLLGCHVDARRGAVEGVPPREVAGFGRPGRFPGIHHDDALGVLDRPRVDREPPRPRVVQKHSRGPTAPAPKLCRLDLYAARLEGMDSDFETIKSGLITAAKESACSMAEKTSCFHLAVRGMSFQSIQVSRLCSSRASWSLRTNCWSSRA